MEIIVDTLQSDDGTLQIADGTQLDFGSDGSLILPGSVVNFAYVEYDGRQEPHAPTTLSLQSHRWRLKFRERLQDLLFM